MIEVVCRNGIPWPPGKKRTHWADRKSGKFAAGGRPLNIPSAIARLTDQIDMFTKRGRSYRTKQIVLCCGHSTYANGRGFKLDSKCPDPGVVVSFDLDGRPYTVACDTYNNLADNFAAIAAYIEGLRAQERHGVANMEEMLAGHAALPSAGSKPFWWNILGLDPNASKEEILEAHKRLIFETHPDRGGDPAKAADINAARDEALTEWTARQ